MPLVWLAGLLWLAAVQLAYSAPVLQGTARVVDGDTLYVGRDKVRVYGIDAPEKAQSCKDSKGKEYACGQISTQALKDKIGNKPVSCQVKTKDQYGRNVAACSIKGAAQQPEDLGAYMVSNGYAAAYRAYGKEYIPMEDKARLQKKGMWQGAFTQPSAWRKQQKVQEGQEGPSGQPAPVRPAPRPQQPAAASRPQTPSTSSVGAGTGNKPSYAAVLGG